MRAPATITHVRNALTDLLNDRSITDLQRLRSLEKLSFEIRGFICDLQSRMPERRPRHEPDGGLTRM